MIWEGIMKHIKVIIESFGAEVFVEETALEVFVAETDIAV
jgi:hypothetical protein